MPLLLVRKTKMQKEKELSEMAKLTPSARRDIDFLKQFAEGAYMLNSLKKITTKVPYAKGAFYLSEFLGKTPSAIVQEYKSDAHGNLYECLDKWEKVFRDFATFLENKNFSSATVALYYAGAKALINTNVPRRMSVQAKSPVAISRTIPGVSFDDLKEIFAICSVRERAIITFLKDSGMSRADALILNLENLENFERGDQFIHLSVFRGKESVEYGPFIGPNAVEALRAYFALRRSRGENLTAKSPLFTTEEKPLVRLNLVSINNVFLRITQKAGKRISTHRLRKFFETYMALSVRHPIILKFWMGHKVSKGRDIESRYIIPPIPEQLALYKESYHNIDLTGGSLEERAKAVVKAEFERMLTPEAKAFAEHHDIRYQHRRGKPKAKENCENGEHCGENFAQVQETELLQHLKDGWKIAYKLENGEVIIQRSAQVFFADGVVFFCP
jgi:site-specific recombinase XerC